jgi:hypothetical protein
MYSRYWPFAASTKSRSKGLDRMGRVERAAQAGQKAPRSQCTIGTESRWATASISDMTSERAGRS